MKPNLLTVLAVFASSFITFGTLFTLTVWFVYMGHWGMFDVALVGTLAALTSSVFDSYSYWKIKKSMW